MGGQTLWRCPQSSLGAAPPTPGTAANLKLSSTDSRTKTITEVVEGLGFQQKQEYLGNRKGVSKKGEGFRNLFRKARSLGTMGT